MNKKQELTTILRAKETGSRIKNLLNGDEKKAEKFKAALINIGLDASLSDASTESIVKSAFALAEIGLPLTKNLGLAFIVKYKSQAQPVISSKGWVYLAKKAGIQVKARPIYDCDEYKFVLDENGFDERFSFSPNFEERENNNTRWIKDHLVLIMISTKTAEGFITHTAVTKSKIMQIAQLAKTQMVYNQWGEEMYTAKALKYVLSRTPMIPTISELEPVEAPKQKTIKTVKAVKTEKESFKMVELAPEKVEIIEPKKIWSLKSEFAEWAGEDKQKEDFMEESIKKLGFETGKDLVARLTEKAQIAFLQQVKEGFDKHLKTLAKIKKAQEKARKKEEKAKAILEKMLEETDKDFLEIIKENEEDFFELAENWGFNGKTVEEVMTVLNKQDKKTRERFKSSFVRIQTEENNGQ